MRMNSQTADAEKTVAQMQPAGIPSLSFFILSIKLFRIFLCAQHLAQNRGYCDQRFDFDEPNVDRRGRAWYTGSSQRMETAAVCVVHLFRCVGCAELRAHILWIFKAYWVEETSHPN